MTWKERIMGNPNMESSSEEENANSDQSEEQEEDEEDNLDETVFNSSETAPDKPLGKKALKRRRRALNRRLHGEHQSYGVPVRKLLKGIHPEIGMTGKAMDIMDSIVTGLFEQLATEASRVAKTNKRGTLNHKEIEASVHVVLPAGLAKRAIEEGNKAVSRYVS